MLFYSEKLDNFFSSAEACTKAELEHDKKLEEKNKQEELKNKQENAVKCRKRALAKAVEDADAKVSLAHKEYERAQEQATKLSQEYLKKLDEILDPAKKAVTEAQKEKLQRLQEFNKEFGPYITHQTDEKALDEFNRTVKFFRNIFGI